jgi:predicted PurR-regulated permease PerM
MPQTPPAPWHHGPGRIALVLVGLAVAVMFLAAAKSLLIALVVSVIFFSLIAGTTDRLAALGVPPALASTVIVIALVALILVLALLLARQVNWLVLSGIQYSDQAIAAVAGLFAPLHEDAEATVAGALRSINFGAWLRGFAGQASGLVSGAVMVSLFVPFMLAERKWFATKLAAVTPDPAAAMANGRRLMARVNRYLVVKGFISAVTGLAVYALAWGFGVQLAGFLGVMAFVLNFIPSIGTLLAIVLTGVVGLVELGPTAAVFWLFALTCGVQFFLGNFWDPMLLGRTLQLSSLAIVIGLFVWGMIWGVPGMFLAVPLMVAAQEICAAFPGARWVAVMLSRDGGVGDQTSATA